MALDTELEYVLRCLTCNEDLGIATSLESARCIVVDHLKHEDPQGEYDQAAHRVAVTERTIFSFTW